MRVQLGSPGLGAMRAIHGKKLELNDAVGGLAMREIFPWPGALWRVL